MMEPGTINALEPGLINALWIAAIGFFGGFGWTCGSWAASKIVHKL
jgi:hypothetical protein